MYKDKYELNVQVNGKAVREYYQDGKYYIEARQGSEYSIKLKNHSHKRIMAVFSVDGVDVIKGGLASDAESGYIIDPYSHIVINGYRIDDNNVATFKFDDGKTSYSTQVEYKFNKKDLQKVKQGILAPSKNNGVIGVRIWEEREPKYIKAWKRKEKKSKFYGPSPLSNVMYFSGALPTLGSVAVTTGCSFAYPAMISGGGSFTFKRRDINQFGELEPITNLQLGSRVCNFSSTSYSSTVDTVDYSSNAPIATAYTSSISSYTPSFNVGTTWGRQEEDKVIKVKFEKADTYVDLEIYYLERVELIKLGIDLENHKRVFISGYPKAFDDGEEYCKKPIGWRKQ